MKLCSRTESVARLEVEEILMSVLTYNKQIIIPQAHHYDTRREHDRLLCVATQLEIAFFFSWSAIPLWR